MANRDLASALHAALDAYAADPINNKDRSESWGKLAAVLGLSRRAADALDAMRWVRCEDRKPEPIEDANTFLYTAPVLTWDGHQVLVRYGSYIRGAWNAWCDINQPRRTEPTHWMAMPTPHAPEPDRTEGA